MIIHRLTSLDLSLSISHVLTDPPLDDLSLLSSGILDTLGVVLIIWFSQVQVMRRLFNVDHIDFVVANDGSGKAACGPGVQLPIREDYVRKRLEVSLNILSTKVVPDPLISGGETELLLAIKRKSVVVKWLSNEHRFIAV